MALNEMQERFAEAYCGNGGNAAAAAIEAGYSKKTAKEQGWTLIHKPAIRERVKELLDERRTKYAPLVLKGLAELAANAEAETVKRQALADLGKMVGLADSRLDVTVHSEPTMEELQARIKATMEELGADGDNIVKLFGENAA